MIAIEIAYATSTKQVIIPLQVEENTTIEASIRLSGILAMFPDIDLTRQKVGVFSKTKALTDVVKAGDRIEIYRTLIIDPKEARRKKGESQPR